MPATAKRFPWKSFVALINHQSYKVTLGNEKTALELKIGEGGN